MAIVIILIAISSVTLGAIGAVLAQDYWRQRTRPRELKPILDWRPTLRMDVRAAALDWRPTLRMDVPATAQARSSEDDNVPAIWVLQAEEVRLVESDSGYPRLEIRWRPATRREVRDFVQTYQRSRADEIKERMKKLYASEINVGNFTAIKPDGGERVLSLTDKDSGTGNHVETGEPGSYPLIPEGQTSPIGEATKGSSRRR